MVKDSGIDFLGDAKVAAAQMPSVLLASRRFSPRDASGEDASSILDSSVADGMKQAAAGAASGGIPADTGSRGRAWSVTGNPGNAEPQEVELFATEGSAGGAKA